MNVRKNYRKGTRKEIMELLHMCGIIPERSLKYMRDKNYKVMRMKIHEMVEEGVLTYVKKTKLTRALAIHESRKDKELYDESIAKELQTYYAEYGKTDEKRYCYSKKYADYVRIFYNADTMMFMYGCGIKMLASHKGSLLNKNEEESIYYNSREIKNGINYKADVIDTEEGQIISSSRLRGMVMSQGGIYAIYRFNTLSAYSQNGEYKMKLYLDRIVREKLEEKEEVSQAVIIVDQNNERLLENYIRPENIAGKYSLESMEFVYKKVYGVPADENGQMMMKVFTNNSWREKIINSFNLPCEKGMQGVVCDGYDGNSYYYIYCIPDIKRFRKFIMRAELENNKEKYIVICFDWQVEMVKAVTKGIVKIKKVPFVSYIEEMGLV